ncbi:hypothetical protein DAEQUDRAFT_381722 [Daedalea quercina L-15889]|uniref:Uncharacterized protein n=1 Tax=Daedalea quercina L-15889 TaxID=1314783 RepID=A0A165NZU3_9APHY|nr:hypothetical protein DAEQUDRAFT_381722 [Daedalea quercina L-15889]
MEPVPATFAFDARSWPRCMGMPIVLHQIFRQSDQKFVDMLESLRFARLSPQIIADLKKLSRPITYTDGIEPTELFPVRAHAEGANLERLRQLNSPPKVFNAVDELGRDRQGRRRLQHEVQLALDRLVAQEQVVLKVSSSFYLAYA